MPAVAASLALARGSVGAFPLVLVERLVVLKPVDEKEEEERDVERNMLSSSSEIGDRVGEGVLDPLKISEDVKLSPPTPIPLSLIV